MADVEFKDNSAAVKGLIGEKAIAFLYEAVAEIESQAAENTRVDTGGTKGAWSSVVDEENLEAFVGNTKENAIWEEFGTGEYAVNKDGRKGYWVYVKGGSGASEENGEEKEEKTYSLEEAKKVVAILRKKGLDAYYTKGKEPNRPLQKAFESKKTVIINRAKQLMKEVGSD